MLALLASYQGRVSFTAIAGALNLRSPTQAFREIALIDGVVFLSSDPSGLSLTADLRKELAAAAGPGSLPFRVPEYLACPACKFLCRIEAALEDQVRCPGCGRNYHLRIDSQGRFLLHPGAPPDPVPGLDDEFISSCSVLGLPVDATLEDAKAAYRKLIKENHPDRVFGLGVEIEQLAAEKSKQINQAYEIFTTHFPRPQVLTPYYEQSPPRQPACGLACVMDCGCPLPLWNHGGNPPEWAKQFHPTIARPASLSGHL